VGALVAATTLGCAAPALEAGDAAWWAALTQPPPPAQAWPLDRLAAPEGEPGSPGGSWRLEQRQAGARGALCRGPGADSWRALPDTAPADFAARLRARTQPGGSESYGLAFRWRGADDYYLARVDTRQNNVRLFRRREGTLALLAARDLGVSVGQWHELAVNANGARLGLALDGEPLLQLVDDALAVGGIALWAAPETRVCFDGLWLAPRDAKPRGGAAPH
jgi:hypothetical protein